MSDTTRDPDQDRHIPSADQDVASGQPYDPRKDPDTDLETDHETDPDTAQEEALSGSGANQRDPAEGPDDESATDG